MKKKFTLFIAVLMAWIGFSATATVGDVITDGTFYFNIVAEGDVNEVEIAPKPSGTYTITNRSIFGNYNTVTIGGVTYNVVGIGEGAFRNAQFPTANITNLPSSLRYISDYAFQGVKSGTSDADSNIRFYATIETVSPLAFIDNEINGTINVSGTSDRFKQVESSASRIQYNTNTCWTPCKDGNTLLAVGGKGKVLGNGSGGYKNANKLTLASVYTIVGPHAFHGNSGYTQLDLGNVVEIKEYAFKNSVVEQLTLPATLTTVDPTAFEGASAIFSITCNATTPPAGCVFDDVVYTTIRANGHITVPDGSLDAYKADANWYKFWSAEPPAPAATRVHIAETENGAVAADNLNPEDGATVTLTVTPEAGYTLENITAEAVINSGNAQAPRRLEGPNVGIPVALTTVVEGQTYTFEMPAAPYEVLVTSEFALADYTITVADGIENGTVEAPATANYGDVVNVTVTPATGYQLASLTYTVEGEEPVNIENNQFNMPAANVTINATFSAISYTITVDGEIENGTVEAPTTANYGDAVNVTVTPDTGYELSSLTYTVEGEEPVDIVNNTFNMPAANVTINATFSAIDYTITVDEDIENGEVTAPATANYGETVTLTVTPAEGYQLKSITVTGVNTDVVAPVDEDNKFVMPADDVVITAVFEEIPPVESTITIADTENGTIEVYIGENQIESGAVVAEGTQVMIVLIPDVGYKVNNLTVETTTASGSDGPAGMPRRANVDITPGDNNTYAFNMPGEPVTITAEFVKEVVTGIYDLNVNGNKGVKYVNAMGQVSDRPFEGINIVIDGDKTYKIVK